jgi:hypothetical protein
MYIITENNYTRNTNKKAVRFQNSLIVQPLEQFLTQTFSYICVDHKEFRMKPETEFTPNDPLCQAGN